MVRRVEYVVWFRRVSVTSSYDSAIVPLGFRFQVATFLNALVRMVGPYDPLKEAATTNFFVSGPAVRAVMDDGFVRLLDM